MVEGELRLEALASQTRAAASKPRIKKAGHRGHDRQRSHRLRAQGGTAQPARAQGIEDGCRMAQCRGWRLRAMLNVWTIAPAARECPGNPILKVWSSVEDSSETIKHKPRSRYARSLLTLTTTVTSDRDPSPTDLASLHARSLDSQPLRRRTHCHCTLAAHSAHSHAPLPVQTPVHTLPTHVSTDYIQPYRPVQHGKYRSMHR